MPEEETRKYKVIYVALFVLYRKKEYREYLKRLSRNKVTTKMSKTEEQFGKIKEAKEEEIGKYFAYLAKCLKNDCEESG